jgi:GH24 family phage-related lysozyme (muramidase)
MTPQIATDIVVRDKSASGFASADRRAKGFANSSSQHVKKSGLSEIGKQVGGLSNLRTTGLDGIARAISSIGKAANDVTSYRKLGAEAKAGGDAGAAALEKMGSAGAVAEASLIGAAAAVVALDAGAYMLGDKWAKTGAELDRTSKTAGVAAQDLQGLRAAGDRVGVTADATTASVMGLSGSIYAMRSGASNEGIAVLDRLGVKLKYTKDGAADTIAMLYDLADAIARQKDPQVQGAIARLYGVEGMLPLLRQGSAAMKAKSADFTGSAAALSDKDIAEGVTTQDEAVRFKQRLSSIEKTAGVHAMGVTSSQAKFGVGAMDGAGKALDGVSSAVSGFAQRSATAIEHSAQSLAHGGLEAGRHLVEGGERAAAKMIAGFEGFIDHAKWDRNAYRAGYGSDTVTDAATGQVSRVTPGTKVSRGAALFDLTRRVKSEFMPKVARSVGSEWDTFDDDTKAALTSVAYNYGHLPRNVLAAAQTGDTGAIASAIRAHESDNGGINARRRDAEADAVAGVARAHVTIELKGASSTTVARVTGDPGVDVDLARAHAMTGP